MRREQTRERFADRGVDLYLATRAAEILGEKETPEVEVPELGKKSEVYFLHFASGKKAVLRAFGDRGKFIRYAAAMEHCAGKSLPVPSLIATDGGWTTRLRFARRFALESFVEGVPFIYAEQNREQSEAVVRAVARLHRETGSQWGYLDRLRDASRYKNYLRHHIAKQIEDIASQERSVSYGELGFWHGWFEVQIEEMTAPSSFSLVHHHLAPDDILIAPDGAKAVILDNGSLQFGSFVQDVEETAGFLSKGDPEKRVEWIERYMKEQDHLPAGAEYEKISPLFRAEHRLKRMRALLKKKSAGKEFNETQLAEAIRAIRGLIG